MSPAGRAAVARAAGYRPGPESARAERSPMPVAPSAVWAAIDLPGRPLAGHERPPGLGADLSPVRIHAGRRAAAAARMLGAAAYTFGEDVVLGDGVDTRSATGSRILAHELAHVVQQRSRPSPAIRRQGTPKSRPSAGPAAAGPALEDLGAKTERIWQSLLAFSKRAPAAVHSTLLAVQDYIERYDRAFASFEATLSQAEPDRASRRRGGPAAGDAARVGPVLPRGRAAAPRRVPGGREARAQAAGAGHALGRHQQGRGR